MNISGNTVLITGGGSGIGRAFAERFLKAGSRVIICGRREDVLKDAQARHPELGIRVCDVAQADQRKDLYEWALQTYPALNVIINNAGIQQRIPLAGQPDWEEMDQEISVNLDAPIHLSTLFIPHLLKQTNPVIMNITSGLVFVPLASVPVYCATKAALHSFTLSLRHQLKDTPVSVIEVIPPAVNTDLGGKGLHTFGADVNEFADAIMQQLQAGFRVATFGFSTQMSRASREELESVFISMNQER